MKPHDAAECIASDLLEHREPNAHALGSLGLAILGQVEESPGLDSYELFRRLGFLNYREQLICKWTVARMILANKLERHTNRLQNVDTAGLEVPK